MRNIDKCRVFILLIHVTLSLLMCDVSCDIVEGPQNVAAVVGQEARFNCTSNTNSDEIRWNAGGNPITLSPCTITNAAYQNLYSTESSGTECDLIVKSVSSVTPALHSCFDTNLNNNKAVLLILSEEPSCVIEGSLIQGEQANIVCTVGTVKNNDNEFPRTIEQQTECEGLGSGPVTNIDKYGAQTQVPEVSFPLDTSGTSIGPINCYIRFQFDDNQVGLATVYSGYDPTFEFTIEELLEFCPENTTVTPSNGPYLAGNVLTCNADAYYPATYVWTDNLNPSDPPVEGPTFTLPAEGGKFDVTCTALATGNLTEMCNETATLTGDAILCPQNVTISPEVTVLIVGDILECSAISYPDADYTWYLASDALPEDAINADESGELSHSASISVNVSGELMYTCVASVSLDGVTCNSSAVINVTAVDCNRNVTITPDNPTPLIGDKYSCSAPGFPDAEYIWTDADGNQIGAGETIEVTEAGEFTFVCVARIYVDGKMVCSDTALINGTAIDCNRTITITPDDPTPYVGDVYTCSAPGFPVANYSWYDADGTEVSTQETVNVDAEGDFSLTCKATVFFEGVQRCEYQSTINGTAIVMTTTSDNPTTVVTTTEGPTTEGPTTTLTDEPTTVPTTITVATPTTAPPTTEPSESTTDSTPTELPTESSSSTSSTTATVPTASIKPTEETLPPETVSSTSVSSTSTETGTDSSTATDSDTEMTSASTETTSTTNEIPLGTLIPSIIVPLVALGTLFALLFICCRFVAKGGSAAAAPAAGPSAVRTFKPDPLQFAWSEATPPPNPFSPGNAMRPNYANGYGRF